MAQLLLRGLLASVIFGHTILVLTNALAFFVLPLYTPWYQAIPLMTFIAWISFSRTVNCPLTAVENYIRRKLHVKEVHGFVGYYFVRPTRRALGLRRPGLVNDGA